MQFEMKQRVIAVRQFQHEIREMMVDPATVHKVTTDLQNQGWTAFAHGRPTRITVNQES